MQQFIERPRAQARMHEGPLGDYIDAFTYCLSERGYARDSIRRAIWLISDFSRWMVTRGIAVEQISEGNIDAFLYCRRRYRTPRYEDRTMLLRLRSHLELGGLVTVTSVDIPRTPAQRLVEEYGVYLREVRNLAQTTIVYYKKIAYKLLAGLFADGEVALDQVAVSDITEFIQKTTDQCRIATVCGNVVGIRAFLRFAHHRGLTDVDRSGCIPAPTNWSMSSIPKALNEEQVNQVLAHCDQSTSVGRRDYAILLLLARLGLRGGEVVALRLDDINWERGELHIRNGETRIDRLPLPHDVGAALAAYLSQGRPSCATRQVFIRTQAPIRGLAISTSVSSIVRRAFRRANLAPPSSGSHVLRHSLATQMLRNGASLTEIGQILRHHKQFTTMIYAKVDLVALRALAPAWPGGAK